MRKLISIFSFLLLGLGCSFSQQVKFAHSTTFVQLNWSLNGDRVLHLYDTKGYSWVKVPIDDVRLGEIFVEGDRIYVLRSDKVNIEYENNKFNTISAVVLFFKTDEDVVTFKNLLEKYKKMK